MAILQAIMMPILQSESKDFFGQKVILVNFVYKHMNNLWGTLIYKLLYFNKHYIYLHLCFNLELFHIGLLLLKS